MYWFGPGVSAALIILRSISLNGFASLIRIPPCPLPNCGSLYCPGPGVSAALNIFISISLFGLAFENLPPPGLLQRPVALDGWTWYLLGFFFCLGFDKRLIISIFIGAYFFGDFRTGGPRFPLRLCDVVGRLSYNLLLPLPAVLVFALKLFADADFDGCDLVFIGEAYFDGLLFAAVVLGLLFAFLSLICFLLGFAFLVLFNGSSSSKKFFKNSFFSWSAFVASSNLFFKSTSRLSDIIYCACQLSAS